jgi:hypothetical protein
VATHVDVIDKGEKNPYEKFVIFIAYDRVTREGDVRRNLSPEEEEAAVLLEKQKYERRTGRMLFKFHRDPLAGGMHAINPPKGQVIREDGDRYRYRLAETDPSMTISEVKGNLEEGNDIMVARPAWVAEYL